ncbi:uncharacterized protein RJT20DRAFT_128794 [Scheffersomyces xylosifermentans]|uniref:uncharacterized protein n=1 Tax=Scheffersomyces xylosifermentans TaxID=1304137 RepID=UPI00315CEA7E
MASYNKLPGNGPEQPSLLDDNLIQPDEMTSQPYIIPEPAAPAASEPLRPKVVQPQIPVNTNSHMFQINFYRAYFNLDSDTFFRKIQRALNPLNSSFSATADDDENVTELYGFFWITGTLIFLMFVSSTGSNILSQWLHSDAEDGEKYEYSFELLTKSISLFYGYNLVVPVLLFLITSFVFKFPQKISLTTVISIYGYTNILWFPITIVNFLIVIFISNQKHHLMLNILEWIIVLVSGAVTGLSNLTKLSPIIHKNCLLLNDGNASVANKQYLTLIGGLALAHLLFTILVKVSFFGIKV